MDSTITWLIIYDISSDPQRKKLSSFLDAYGERVQKSAYELALDKKQQQYILLTIKNYPLDPDDSIRIYELKSDSMIYPMVEITAPKTIF